MTNPDRILVLGHTGFIGRWISKVGGLHRGVSKKDGLLTSEGLDRFRRLVRDPVPPSLVIHAAGAVGTDDPRTLQSAILDTTRVMFEVLATESPDCRVIVIGSAAEIPIEQGLDGSTYGRMKHRQTTLARSLAHRFRIPLTVLRLHNTLGPGQGTALLAGALVDRLHQSISSGEAEMVVRDPDSIRDYLDVRDVARVVLRLGESSDLPWDGTDLEVCSGQGRSVAALVGELVAAVGSTIAITFLRDPSERGNRFIGDPAPVQHYLGSEPIQTISAIESLRDMWNSRRAIENRSDHMS